jgi:signal peptidase I
MDPILLVADALWLLVYFAITLWMLLDAIRRGRGWIRWQLLLHVLTIVVAVPIWLFRRRRWPVTVEITRARRLKLAALAAGIVAATFTLSSAVNAAVATRFQIARVEGQTMAPALNDQDRLFINTQVYRVGDPAIGDIVMLRYPLDPEKLFVKRVIASDGDELQIVNGLVLRNGGRVDEPYVLHANRGQDDWGPMVVPDGTYFVLGDNRIDSADSRIFGFVPRDYVLGRVTSRWWPLSALRRF